MQVLTSSYATLSIINKQNKKLIKFINYTLRIGVQLIYCLHKLRTK